MSPYVLWGCWQYDLHISAVMAFFHAGGMLLDTESKLRENLTSVHAKFLQLPWLLVASVEWCDSRECNQLQVNSDTWLVERCLLVLWPHQDVYKRDCLCIQCSILRVTFTEQLYQQEEHAISQKKCRFHLQFEFDLNPSRPDLLVYNRDNVSNYTTVLMAYVPRGIYSCPIVNLCNYRTAILCYTFRSRLLDSCNTYMFYPSLHLYSIASLV